MSAVGAAAIDSNTVVLFAHPADANRERYLQILATEGFVGVAVDTPLEALEYSDMFTAPRIAVVELSPASDEGWEAVMRLRQQYPAVAVIVLTARVRPNEFRRQLARAYGCAAFVARPFSVRQFVDVIVRVAAGERGIELVDHVLLA